MYTASLHTFQNGLARKQTTHLVKRTLSENLQAIEALWNVQNFDSYLAKQLINQ